jgi:conjugal transfer pilus assembly protein TraE
MNFSNFKSTWTGTRSENLFLRVITAGLLLSTMTLGGVVAYRGTEVVLVPPTISESMTVGKHNADAGYKKAFATYAAQTVGNVTPTNVDFVLEMLRDLMAPNVYHAFRQSLAEQINDLKKSNLAMSFEPGQLFYEPATDKVFVTGRSIVRGSGASLETSQRCYEVTVEMKSGRPTVTGLDAYDGDPHTAQWLERQKDRETK